MPKKRFVLVGTGGRAINFVRPVVDTYRDHNELVAFCDISQVRMDAYNQRIQDDFGCDPIPTLKPEQLKDFLLKEKPEGVIVTSKDVTHDDFINLAVECGCEVVTEKPMTIDAARTISILEAVQKHNGKVRVTFNYRWIPGPTRVKELLVDGTIGTVRSVNLEYLLNTSHGADYFRRWHSQMSECGGLLVHKSTHHFDLVNWWLDAVPSSVFAFGRLAFYGKENAIARGDEALTGYERYTDEPRAKEDPFALDLKDGANLEQLYYNAEAETGYRRDLNVFREGIDIYDSMSVNVRYRTDAILTYSLNAFSPREGERVTFNGDRGRIEYTAFGGAHIIRGQSEEELAAEQEKDKGEHSIRVFPHFKDPYSVEIPKSKGGGHGGSDVLLADQIFGPNPPQDNLHRNAGHEQGAASILIGIAANTAIKEERMVRVDDLCPILPTHAKLSELV